MKPKLRQVHYASLNARQKENYNYQKVSAILADYGYVTMRLSDDWDGADFIAKHIREKEILKVQLKGRLDFRKKYLGKEIYVAFHAKKTDIWYLYPHDELLNELGHAGFVVNTTAWSNGGYSFANLSPELQHLLEPYRLGTTPLTKR
jgi:hypothetical protein